MLDTVKNRLNGLDLGALGEVVEAIEQDAGQAQVGFDVITQWTGQTRSETMVEGFDLAGNRITRRHKIVADEPCELLGSLSPSNPIQNESEDCHGNHAERLGVRARRGGWAFCAAEQARRRRRRAGECARSAVASRNKCLAARGALRPERARVVALPSRLN